jgi:PAS domain S-box-containing protein
MGKTTPVIGGPTQGGSQVSGALPSSGDLWDALGGSPSSDHLMILDDQGVIRWVNRVAEGVRPEQVIGHRLMDLCPADEQEALARWLDRLRRGEEPGSLLGSFPTPGGLRWYDCRGQAIHRAGQPLTLLLQARDVTADHAERAALAASEEKFRSLVEHSPDAICLFDAAGIIRYANPSSRRVIGYDPATAFGGDGWKNIHPEDRPAMREAQMKILQHPGESLDISRFRVRHGEGGWRWLEAVATNLLELPSVKAIVGVYRDVTARIQLEEQLRQSQKMEAIGLLAGGVAHDFNNLLTVILASADSVRNSLPANHPAHDDLANIAKGARTAAELTQKLLTFARRQVHVSAPFDLRDVLVTFGGLLRRIVGEDVAVQIDPGGDPLPMEGDQAQIQQLLLNLATNARQAMPGGGRLHLQARRLDRTAAPDGSQCEIEVTDTGVGMDAATRDRVFEPFFTTRPGGTGLGLPVVQMVVQDHKGSLQVDSEPGRGTTVRVRLPLRASGVPAPAPGPAAIVRGSGTVLLVEDEVLLRDLLARSLRVLGYTVLTASDGDEAVATFEREQARIDVVVMDVIMPRLGGKEAAQRMSAHRPDLKVVLMTGYAPDSAQIAEVLVPGRVVLMHKPFVAGDLATQIRALITSA